MIAAWERAPPAKGATGEASEGQAGREAELRVESLAVERGQHAEGTAEGEPHLAGVPVGALQADSRGQVGVGEGLRPGPASEEGPAGVRTQGVRTQGVPHTEGRLESEVALGPAIDGQVRASVRIEEGPLRFTAPPELRVVTLPRLRR